MWYLYTMEFYSAMKQNEILSFASKWMGLENIILSEVSQAQKIKGKYSKGTGLWSHDKARAHREV
jgi:alkyl hydroperoxide reductase subunit AhpF